MSSGAWSDGFGPLRKLRSMPDARDPGRERAPTEQEIDAKAQAAVEVALAVVPPRELLRHPGRDWRYASTIPASRIGGQPLALVRRSRASRPRRRRGRRRRRRPAATLKSPAITTSAPRRTPARAAHRVEEGELLGERSGADARGRWARRCCATRRPPDVGLDPAGLLGTDARRAGPARRRSAARPSRATIATPAQRPARVVHGAVARRGQLGDREGVGLGLGLLQAGDVGRVHARGTRARAAAAPQRVDVPGGAIFCVQSTHPPRPPPSTTASSPVTWPRRGHEPRDGGCDLGRRRRPGPAGRKDAEAAIPASASSPSWAARRAGRRFGVARADAWRGAVGPSSMASTRVRLTTAAFRRAA